MCSTFVSGSKETTIRAWKRPRAIHYNNDGNDDDSRAFRDNAPGWMAPELLQSESSIEKAARPATFDK